MKNRVQIEQPNGLGASSGLAAVDRLLQARWGKWVLFIVGWAALSLLFTPEAYLHFYLHDQAIPWRLTFQLTVANAAIALLFLPGIVWLARRFPVESRHLAKALLVHVPACFLFSVGHSCLYWLSCYASNQVGEELFFRFHPNLLTYWAIVGFTQAVDYFRRYTRRERELAEAHLLLLKSQLHPHFLFNALHAVSAAMHEDLKSADRIISRLSDLLRLTIDSIGKHEVTLKQELDFVQKYLEIERIRYQERLTLALDLDSAALDAVIPSMVLQPLIENSIRHGFGTTMKDAEITIEARRAAERLVLRVKDNGSGFRQPNIARGAGVGISNIRKRLDQLYPANYHFECGSQEKTGAVVSIDVPFRTAHLEAPSSAELISDDCTSLDRGRRALGETPDCYLAKD
ncbi:MAG TPA: histidine kinase [Blastocatellia bacterium]|nr:histidine kinase [Blastocatellia bacterium]